MSDAAHSIETDHSLWDFAGEVYSAPSVADACLALQDRYNCDVNLLLFAAWMGAVRNRTLTSGEMNGAAHAVRDWHAEIVRPLRDVRRRLKSGPSPAADASESLRARIKSVEIEAERLELAALQKLATKWHAGNDKPEGRVLRNLEIALRLSIAGEPSSETLDLIRAIERGLIHMSSPASSRCKG
jgi:uncharacterized protein (TIGR02444 family)